MNKSSLNGVKSVSKYESVMRNNYFLNTYITRGVYTKEHGIEAALFF